MKINIFIFKVLKINTKKGWANQKKEKLLLLMSENIGDRNLSVCKTVEYQLNIEKKVKGVSIIKYFKRMNFFN